MHRFFTVGCSFTHYRWPCWPEIIQKQLEGKIKVYNYGMSGIGNVGISYRILEADMMHKFTPEDKIIIMWTSWNREDRLMGGNYLQHGNTFSDNGGRTWSKFMREFDSPSHDALKNITAMHYVNKTYGDMIMYQACRLDQHYEDAVIGLPLLDHFKDFTIDMLYKNLETGDPSFEGLHNDPHPDILAHLQIVKEQMPIEIDRKTEQYWIDIQNTCVNELRKGRKIYEVLDELGYPFNPREFMQ